jgi:histone H3/H4
MATLSNVHVSDELLAQLREAAHSEGKTVAQLASDALTRYVKQREDAQRLKNLANRCSEHASRHGFRPEDVQRAIDEVRRGQ